MKRSTHPPPSQQPELVGQWLATMRPSTQKAYAGDLRAFLVAAELTVDRLQRLDTGEVTAHLGGWRERLAQVLAASSVNRKLGAVRSFCIWLVTHRHVSWHRAPAVPYLKTARPARPAVSRAQVARVLHELDDTTARGASNAALIRVFWDLGIRLSEALGLTGADLNLDAEPPTISIQAKGGGRQELLLPRATADALRRLELRDSARVFALDERTVQRRIVALGLLSPHAIRRGGATNAHAAGVSLRCIQDYLRHERIETTAQYIQHDPAQAALRVSNVIAIERPQRQLPLKVEK